MTRIGVRLASLSYIARLPTGSTMQYLEPLSSRFMLRLIAVRPDSASSCSMLASMSDLLPAELTRRQDVAFAA